MKGFKIFILILNVITISIYLGITVFTTIELINYINLEKPYPEGTISFALVYIFNSFGCLIQFLLNIIGIIVIISNKEKLTYEDNQLKYKKQLRWRVIIIFLPILTFIIQLIINNVVNKI